MTAYAAGIRYGMLIQKPAHTAPAARLIHTQIINIQSLDISQNIIMQSLLNNAETITDNQIV